MYLLFYLKGTLKSKHKTGVNESIKLEVAGCVKTNSVCTID
jgi:hypothetical protein